MAVRQQQLWEVLRDRQPPGTIVVERPSCAAAARTSHSAPPPLRPSPPPSPPAVAEPAPPPPLPRRQGVLPQLCAVFHCRGCWAVLADSLQLCSPGTARLGFLLVCCKVTSDVVWEDSLLIGLEGPLLGCAYNALSCRSCGLAVGLILVSAPRDLASIRGLFCFFKDKIICYLLENQMVIEASKVDFPDVTLREQVKELKEKLLEFNYRIELLTKKLEELE